MRLCQKILSLHYIVAHIRPKCKKNNKKVEKYNKTKKGYRDEPLFSALRRK